MNLIFLRIVNFLLPWPTYKERMTVYLSVKMTITLTCKKNARNLLSISITYCAPLNTIRFLSRNSCLRTKVQHNLQHLHCSYSYFIVHCQYVKSLKSRLWIRLCYHVKFQCFYVWLHIWKSHFFAHTVEITNSTLFDQQFSLHF